MMKIRKKFLASNLLLFLVLALAPGAGTEAHAKQVILWVDLGISADFPLIEKAVKRIQGEIRQTFPEGEVRLVQVSSADRPSADPYEELKLQLDRVLDPGDQISHLFIDSHGLPNYLVTGNNLVAGSQHGIPLADPSRPGEGVGAPKTANIFSGIRGRFAPGAKVLLRGCQILQRNDGTNGTGTSTTRERLSALQDILNLESGSIYANRTLGAWFTDIKWADWSFKSQHKWLLKVLRNRNILVPVVSTAVLAELGYLGYQRYSGASFGIGSYAMLTHAALYLGANAWAAMRPVHPEVLARHAQRLSELSETSNQGYSARIVRHRLEAVTPDTFENAEKTFSSADPSY